MATVNYSFNLPQVGADQDAWGALLNENWEDLDTLLESTVGSINADVSDRVKYDDEATLSQLLSGAAGDKFISPRRVDEFSDPETMTRSQSTTLDMNNARNFEITLAGAVTLENPSNRRPGQNGVIIIKQDSTGGHALSFGSEWEFLGQSAVSAVPDSVGLIAYYVDSGSKVRAILSLGDD